jgi:hypothetical protein
MPLSSRIANMHRNMPPFFTTCVVPHASKRISRLNRLYKSWTASEMDSFLYVLTMRYGDRHFFGRIPFHKNEFQRTISAFFRRGIVKCYISIDIMAGTNWSKPNIGNRMPSIGKIEHAQIISYLLNF